MSPAPPNTKGFRPKPESFFYAQLPFDGTIDGIKQIIYFTFNLISIFTNKKSRGFLPGPHQIYLVISSTTVTIPFSILGI
jgi:hypothetical protein